MKSGITLWNTVPSNSGSFSLEPYLGYEVSGYQVRRSDPPWGSDPPRRPRAERARDAVGRGRSAPSGQGSALGSPAADQGTPGEAPAARPGDESHRVEDRPDAVRA